MADTSSNLELIEESDVDLASKFGGKSKSVEIVSDSTVPEVKEAPAVSERVMERKEGGAEKEAAYARILSKASAQTKEPSKEEEIKKDAEILSSEQDAESRINNLLGLAQTKGVIHAVKVAKDFEDNYVMDELHDRLLADELHDALMQKGLIKDL